MGKVSLLGDFVNIDHDSLLYNPAIVSVTSISYMRYYETSHAPVLCSAKDS